MNNRRRLIGAVLGAAAVAPRLAFAQTRYPSRPIRIVLATAPGNVLDATTRLVAPRLAERLGQPVSVDNIADANMCLHGVAKAPPDGYTLAGVLAGQLVIAPHAEKRVVYDPLKDFEPVALAATSYFVLATHPTAPFRTVAEMVGWAKAHPGKLAVGTSGEGSLTHIAFEDLRAHGEFTYRHITLRNPIDLAGDLASGQVQVTIGGITALNPFIRSGKLRLLATTHPTRVNPWPDVPTAAEALPGFAATGWFGYLAPAGTPREVVLRLNQSIGEIVKSPGVADKLTGTGLIATAPSPERFAELIQRDHAHYGKLLRTLAFATK